MGMIPLFHRVVEAPRVKSSAKGKMPDMCRAVIMLQWTDSLYQTRRETDA